MKIIQKTILNGIIEFNKEKKYPSYRELMAKIELPLTTIYDNSKKLIEEGYIEYKTKGLHALKDENNNDIFDNEKIIKRLKKQANDYVKITTGEIVYINRNQRNIDKNNIIKDILECIDRLI